MTRNLVVPLTSAQIVTRALYLAREVAADKLDDHVDWSRVDGGDSDAHKLRCPEIYYLLRDHNGGKDPTALHPADLWSKQGEVFVNRTCDCVGGASWCGGFDRWQPIRFGHVPGYDGWINTDSMMWEVRHCGRCFVSEAKPRAGLFIVCESGSLHHAIGHIGVIVGYTLDYWDPADHRCWEAIQVVNVAAYHNQDGSPAIANQRTTGVGWFGTGAMFVRSIMKE